MTKLEKSIRHELSYIGPGLRAGSYGMAGRHSGILPRRGLAESLYCDVDAGQGTVTGIRMYGPGDARERRDHDGESVDITEALEHFLTGNGEDYTWDDFVGEIAETAQGAIACSGKTE